MRDAAGVTVRGVLRAASRLVDRLLSRGLYRGPLSFARDRVVLLFFEDVGRDLLLPSDRYLRRAARRIARALRGGQKVSGFAVAVDALVRSLHRHGYRVVINDRALARKNPDYPVGIAGYPPVLDGWDLPNPAILGPGLFDHPGLRPQLMGDPRFRWYIAHSDWVRALFETEWPGRCFNWFAGIDLADWTDQAAAPKEIDLLLYEKFLWDREERRASLLQPIEAELARRGLRVERLRYGAYTHDQYRRLLSRSRGMLFLCEHETQGIACQEALASNVPVLAWDQGFWLDPLRFRFGQAEVPASSTPYFAPECGEKFRGLEDFGAALERFLGRLDTYRPREYVQRNLSLDKSGAVYLERYAALANG